jgi:hypothetical protein
VFYLRHSSNWNPHRLHSEPFPPKENHNVGLLRFDDDHDHICYRFAQVQIFGGKNNVFKSLQLFENLKFSVNFGKFLIHSYLYHKARKCYFASASTVCGTEAPTEAALVRALAKHFLAV